MTGDLGGEGGREFAEDVKLEVKELVQRSWSCKRKEGSTIEIKSSGSSQVVGALVALERVGVLS